MDSYDKNIKNEVNYLKFKIPKKILVTCFQDNHSDLKD